MIYIKENNDYLKYRYGEGGRLICSTRNGNESVILTNISNEFDAVCSDDGRLHFIIQGLGGELIYLCRDKDVWKKYEIFKSRKGIKKISSLTLCVSQGSLCAFYIMEHSGKNLMVKHRFSSDKLYEEPEVVGICSAKKIFCVYKGTNSEYNLIFQNSEGKFTAFNYDAAFNFTQATDMSFDENVLSINTVCNDKNTYIVYTADTKNSIALIFCNKNFAESKKIISFGLRKKSVPELIIYNNQIIIQWEENGAVMQSVSSDLGNSFSKPKAINADCHFAKIRFAPKDDGFICNRAAAYNFKPYIMEMSGGRNNIVSGKRSNMNSIYTSEIKNPDLSKTMMEKLKNIENDISKLGKSLEEICLFLDDLKTFKENIPTAGQNFRNKDSDEGLRLSKNDIGEINEDNLKLFENTDIDSVLVEIQDK